MAHQPDTFVQIGSELARQGGRLARGRLGQAVVSRKADRSLVTDVDCQVQQLIVSQLSERFPDHAMLAEEADQTLASRPDPADAEFCWVIDPLDGTRNYARGLPIFTTSIALLQAGSPIVGVTYDPMLDQLYSAMAGGGAWLGSNRLQVADRPAHRDSLITVPSGRNRPLPAGVERWTKIMTIRSLGSTALHMALIAAGLMDAELEVDSKLWDVAAGALLVSEAGGCVTGLKGEPLFPYPLAGYRGQDIAYLAAGPRLHAELLKMLE
jgi:myo-inositol-1(or 4)-monophosphatase